MDSINTQEFFYGILHNRKTGGTALQQAIAVQKKRLPESKIQCFNHAMTFPLFVKRFPNAQAIFFIREPLSRFVSGFYSRLRQGQPRLNHPWNRKETKAFARFKTPNELAEALSSNRFWTYLAAIRAMRSIGHVKHTYVDFLGSLSFIKRATHRIAYIGNQPDLNEDFNYLREILTIDQDIQIATDEKNSHKNPSHFDLFLSEKAIVNLKKWYKKDIEIYEWCREERLRRLANFEVTRGRLFSSC